MREHLLEKAAREREGGVHDAPVDDIDMGDAVGRFDEGEGLKTKTTGVPLTSPVDAVEEAAATF